MILYGPFIALSTTPAYSLGVERYCYLWCVVILWYIQNVGYNTSISSVASNDMKYLNSSCAPHVGWHAKSRNWPYRFTNVSLLHLSWLFSSSAWIYRSSSLSFHAFLTLSHLLLSILSSSFLCSIVVIKFIFYDYLHTFMWFYSHVRAHTNTHTHTQAHARIQTHMH